MATLDLELVASILAVGGSIFAIANSYARKDLSNYKELDQARDRLRSQTAANSSKISQVERDTENAIKIERLERKAQGTAIASEIQQLHQRCNRHRREIEQMKGYLTKGFDFQPRETDTGDQSKFL